MISSKLSSVIQRQGVKDPEHSSRPGAHPWKSDEARERLLKEFSAILDRVVAQLSSSDALLGELFTVEQAQIKPRPISEQSQDDMNFPEEKNAVAESKQQAIQLQDGAAKSEDASKEPDTNSEDEVEEVKEEKTNAEQKHEATGKPDNSVPSEHASLIARVATQHIDKEVEGDDVGDQQLAQIEAPKPSAKHAVSHDSAPKKEANSDNGFKPGGEFNQAQKPTQAKVEALDREVVSEASKKPQTFKSSVVIQTPPASSEPPVAPEQVRRHVQEVELFARAFSAKINHGLTVRSVATTNAASSSVQETSGAGAARGDAAERTRKPREPQPLTRQNVTKAFERVQDALKEVVKSRDGKTISVRLDPPELGSVKIDISLKNGNLHARIVTEAQHVNALLRDRSHELQQMLRQLAGDVEHVTVSIVSGHGDNAADGSSTAPKQQGFENGEHKGWAAPGAKSQGAATSPDAASQSKVYDHWVA